MIIIGKPKLTKERREVMKKAIIAPLPTDKVRRMWHGNGPGIDLWVVEFVTVEGDHWLLGRIRIHKDEKVLGSDDDKEPVCVGVGHELPKEAIDTAVGVIQAAAAASGIREIFEIPCGDAPPVEIPKLMEKASQVVPGLCFSSVTRDPPKEKK